MENTSAADFGEYERTHYCGRLGWAAVSGPSGTQRGEAWVDAL